MSTHTTHSLPALTDDHRLACKTSFLPTGFRHLVLSASLTLSVIVSIVSAPSAAAETLYQWQEIDGSLTFSPTPPPEGSNIKFKVVESAQQVNPVAALDDSQSASSLAEISAASKSTVSTNQPSANSTPINRLAYANDSGNGDLPAGISAATQQGATTTATDTTAQNDQNTPERQAKLARMQDCENLNKRVVALENHMKHSTTAEEMDRAVLQIARYQNSIDGYCNN